MRLETERLILREWRDEDRAPFAAIIGNPEVRRFFPTLGTRADADAGIDRAIARLAEHHMSFLPVLRKADNAFLGMTGLAPIGDDLRAAIPSHPEVEIGWQLDKSCWGRGYAPEAAQAWLDYAWETLELPEVVAFTAAINLPSRRVMEKLGMVRAPEDDFEHPGVTVGHVLRPHVLYRVGKP